MYILPKMENPSLSHMYRIMGTHSQGTYTQQACPQSIPLLLPVKDIMSGHEAKNHYKLEVVWPLAQIMSSLPIFRIREVRLGEVK